MKKTVCFIIAVAVTALALAFAVSAENGVVYTLSDDGQYYILTSYKNNEAEVKISASYNGLPVKKIAKDAFAGNFSTYKIIIPDSVTEIEGGAFDGMASLSEFEASGAFTSVDGALYTSDKKTLVRYPQAKTGDFIVPNGVAVYARAFSGTSLSSVDASGAVAIGEYAFYLADIKTAAFSAKFFKRLETLTCSMASCVKEVVRDVHQDIFRG